MTREEITEALNELFGNTKRSQAETLNDLEEIQADLETMIDALKEDMRHTR